MCLHRKKYIIFFPRHKKKILIKIISAPGRDDREPGRRIKSSRKLGCRTRLLSAVIFIQEFYTRNRHGP